MALDLRPHARRKPVLNITSLIDVLFLMLIFFMVSSTFVEHPAIKLDLPQAASADNVRTDTLTLSITPDGALYLNDEPTTMAALGPALSEAVAENAELALILKADQTVDYGVVIKAIDEAKQAGVKYVTAFTAVPSERRNP